MLEPIALSAFAGLLIYAACTDIASLTIPNWVSIALAALFIPMAMLIGMPLAEIGVHLVFGFSLLAVGFFLFQANIIGGGDAKLLAAAAIWTGFPGFVSFLFWTAIAGGALALALLGARKWIARSESQPAFVNRLLTPESGVPYGVAIMLGGLAALPALPFAAHALTLP
jgi:prepilin peptidase CpaA